MNKKTGGKTGGNKSTPKAANAKVPFGEFWFVRLELSADDKEKFHEWLEATPTYWEYLDAAMNDGCKVSFTLDPVSTGVLCSASQPNAHHENAGGILTGRGGDAKTALQVLQFKDEILCGGGNWKQAEYEHRQGGLDIG